ncbi:hypothetical protein N656DRAFT_784316 [Canariomyces notabilis]|uniref:Uncharacterized protein n=1 Tax=Canariomyces notabilis TaxID=2074819 RepID=A0AAN6QJD6_9PEZI|nr:hypothetical protein N656DRAFT_784316 [Canariomyces arenarius]
MDYLSQRAVEVVARAEYLRGRLDLQNTAVNNFLALRMAETSKSVAVASWIESTAAKYVAVVGLVFVPAASIATIFGVPLDSQANYWLITVFVTIVLMVVCVPVFGKSSMRRPEVRDLATRVGG